MPRKPRRVQHAESACYHVISRGHNRETLFRDGEDFRYFLELLARYRGRLGFRLYHYCLMGNHFHLLWQLPRPGWLSALLAGLLRSYVHYHHGRYGFVGHLLHGRFKSPAVDTDEYLLSCGRSIERNPLRAGLVAEPWSYPWSSCAAYALGKADLLLADNPWYDALAPDPARRRELWRAFLLGEDPNEVAVEQAGWVVGGEAFRRRMQQRQPRPTPRRGGRPPATRAPRPDRGPVFPEFLGLQELP